MNRNLLLLCLLTLPAFMLAQNVGVGTTAPKSKLHVYTGPSGATPFPTSPLVVESGGNTYVNLLSPDPNETGILFGQPANAAAGVIVYNNVSTPNGFQFRNNGNITRMVIDNAGKIGIGTLTPQFPLSLDGSTGDKISLWSDGTSTHYGFGIQGGLLQIFSKTINDDIAFGYGNSTAFTERMRIKGNGNLGIGVSDPSMRLDIGGRMKIRTGTDGEAGIWLNNVANSNIAAFIGLENDNYVGFYGIAAGWKFGMNTQTGALKINGSEGSAGQVLQSGGNGPATWASSTNTLYNNSNMVTGTGLVTIAQGDARTLISGLSQTVTVAGNAKLLISFVLPVNALSCTFCGTSSANVYMRLNSNQVSIYSHDLANASSALMSGTNLVSVGPGTYIIDLVADVYGPNIRFYQNSAYATSSMIVQVIPQ